MNTREYQEKAMSLRHNPMVKEWIKERQKEGWNRCKDCKKCGFPHSDGLLCNGAPFGEIHFGGDKYYVSMSNVVFWTEFMQDHAPQGTFHWKHQRYFRRTDAGVEVTFFSKYNNTPQTHTWLIPDLEWQSIVDSCRLKGEGRGSL